MSQYGANVRNLDWADFEPSEVSDAHALSGRKGRPFRPWMLVVLYVLTVAVFGVSEFYERRANAAEGAADALSSFGKQVLSLESGLRSAELQEGPLELILKGEVGFQSIEASVRQSDPAIARQIGEVWSTVRRDALVPKIDPENLRDCKRLAERGHRSLRTFAKSAIETSHLFKILGIGFFLYCLFATLRSLGQRGTTVVVQSIVNSISNQEESTLSPMHGLSKTVIDQIPLSVCEIAEDGHIVSWNKTIADITGISAEYAIGRPFIELLGWRDMGDIAKTTFYKLFTGESVTGIIWTYRHSSGETLELRGSFVPILDERGGVERVFAAIADITIEIRQRQQLVENDATKTAMLESIPDTLVRLDHEGRILELHDNGGFFGQNAWKVLSGDQWKQRLPEELVTDLTTNVRSALVYRRKNEFEYTGMVEGTWRTLSVRVAPCGQAEVLVLVADVTERHRSDLEIKHSESRFRRLIEISDVGVVILNADQTVLYVNTSARKQFGHEIGADAETVLSSVSPDQRAVLHQAIQQLVRQPGAAFSVNTEVETTDEGAVSVELRFKNLLHDAGVGGILMTVRRTVAAQTLAVTPDLEEETRRQIHASLYTDSLTGLADHRGTNRYLEAALQFVREGGGTVSLVYVDIDAFGRIVTEDGHAVGDEVLRSVAGQVQTLCRESDIAGRYSTDTFLLIAPETTMQEANAMAEAIKREAVRSVSCVVLNLAPGDDWTLEDVVRTLAYSSKAAKEQNGPVCIDKPAKAA